MPVPPSQETTTHLVLSALRDDHRVRQVGSAGVWEDGRIEDLTVMANGFDPGQVDARIYDVLSIPDVWAQAEVFRMALSDKAGDLYQQTRAEWRGLLALFALRDANNCPLNVAIIHLDAHDAERSGTRPLPRPLQALSRMAPKVSINGNTQPWPRVGIIQASGQAVGLLVPSTLVCPSRTHLPASMDKSIRWCQQGRLKDPVGPDSPLSDEELLALQKFLAEGMQLITGNNDEIVAMLLHEMTAYHRDCTDLLRRRRPDREGPAFVSYALGLALPGPEFRCLQTAWRVNTPPDPQFDTMVTLRSDLPRDRRGAEPSIILVDPNIATITSKPPGSIMLCGGVSLERYLNHPDAETLVRERVTQSGHIHVEPKQFFSERLCLLGHGEIQSHKGDLRRMLLPVTPLALLVMSAADLMNNLEVIKQPERNGYLARLHLRLRSSRHGREEGHVVERFYSNTDIVYSEVPSALSLWPNFRSPAWNRYFVFYGGRPSHHFTIRSLLSPSSLAMAVAGGDGAPHGHDASMRLQHCLMSDGQNAAMAKHLPFDAGATQGGIFRAEQAPEALFCIAPDSGGGPGGTRQMTAGLLVMPEGMLIDAGAPREPWRIGIDFGTTKTTVYVGKGRQDPAPISFANRILSPFPVTEASVRSHWDYVPQREAQIPFITALRVRRDEAWAMPSAIMSCLIYYIDNMEQVAGDLKSDQSRSTLQLNLKWANQHDDSNDRRDGHDDRRARQYIQLFLEQVVLQAAAEACAAGITPGQIGWAFSYPEAFRSTQLIDFQEACKLAVGNAVAGTRTESPVFMAESLSTAMFFDRKMKVQLAEPVVTIDIGGRTADISIWQDNNLLWRNSVELAGQNILIDLLVTHTDLLHDRLTIGTWDNKTRQRYTEAFNDLASVSDVEARTFSVEVLMGNTEFGQTFTRDLHLLAGQPKVAMMKGIASLALAGLLHYTAQTLKWLAADDVFKPLLPGQQVTVCLGGRVADLFQKVVPLDDNKNSIIQFFEAAGGDLFKKARIKFSNLPKHEVAYGLLVKQDPDHKDTRHLGVITGEQVTLNGTVHPPDRTLATLGITDIWRVSELVALKDLVRQVGRIMRIQITWNERLETEIITAVNGEIGAYLRKARAEVEEDTLDVGMEESTTIEPPFIMALRDLIRRIVREQTQLRIL